MLGPYPLTPSAQVSDRHLANPPAQWIIFFLSSVIVHILAFWLIPGLAMRQQTDRFSNEPVPVRLIDLSAIAPRLGSPQGTSVQPPATVPQTPVPTTPPLQRVPIQRAENLPAPVVPDAVQTLPVKPRQSTVTPRRVTPSPQRSPKPTSERTAKRTAKPRISQTTPLKKRSPSSSASKPAATTNSAKSSANTKPASQEASKPNSGSASSSETPVNTPQTTSQKPASGSQETTTSKPLPETASPTTNPATSASEPSRTPQGSESQNGSLVASLSNPRLANGGTDVPDKLATPQQQERRFSGLTYPARVGMNPNQAIVLQVLLLIDSKGQATVQATKVLQGGGGFDAESLAREMIKDWKFAPATQAGQAVDSLLEVTLTVNS